MKEFKNELSQALSPYLLQHAHQQVAWQIWDKKYFKEDLNGEKLLLISIGYSACHWCHVMAHESFDDPKVAQFMNQNFINFKIDREERPDIDQIYMSALQILTGQGGWPLNIIALPDGQPIWGTTYMSKENWLSALQQIQEIHKHQPQKLIDQAHLIQEGIKQLIPLKSLVSPKKPITIDPTLLMEKLYAKVDQTYGGFMGAPKFMMPIQLHLWLCAGLVLQRNHYLKHFHNSLHKMAFGGLFDPIEGGFSRYSVDAEWHVPHFEKMAYDNGQLLTTYSKAYLINPSTTYEKVVCKTISFIQTNLSDKAGGVYSALDADSTNEKGKMEEGAYYVWTPSELKKLLKDDFSLFASYFQVNEIGYWENGKYVLFRAKSIAEFSEQKQIPAAEMEKKVSDWEKILKKARNKRYSPSIDDKQICSWNAMVCEGILIASRVFKSEHYLDLALKSVAFIEDKFVLSKQQLIRIHKKNTRQIKGLLEDYAHLIKLYVTAYETLFVESYLTKAVLLTDHVIAYFFDPKEGFFNNTQEQEELPWSRSIEIEDNVIVSSNAQMVENLLRLGIHHNNPDYNKLGLQILSQMQGTITQYPRSYSHWITLSLWVSYPSVEIAVVGPDYKNVISQLQQHPYPFIVWAGATSATSHPLLLNRGESGKTLIYFCRNRQCDLPEKEWEKVWKNLNLLLN